MYDCDGLKIAGTCSINCHVAHASVGRSVCMCVCVSVCQPVSLSVCRSVNCGKTADWI